MLIFPHILICSVCITINNLSIWPWPNLSLYLYIYISAITLILHDAYHVQLYIYTYFSVIWISVHKNVVWYTFDFGCATHVFVYTYRCDEEYIAAIYIGVETNVLFKPVFCSNKSYTPVPFFCYQKALHQKNKLNENRC